jgi:REP element-mobilizing transposase RayT
MARPPRVFGPGLLYHVVARGNRREAVFLGHGDYKTYLCRLAVYRARYEVTVHAYCLMPNHVHLVLGTAEAPLDRFMQSLQQSYTQRFNRRYGLTGHVFQGRYKAMLCQTDEYLMTLVRYVHQNPVRAGLAARAADYPYSGHHVYLAEQATDLVDPTFVLRLVGGVHGYLRLIASDTMGGEPVPDSPAAPLPGEGASSTLRPPPASLPAALRDVAAELRVDVDILRGPDRRRSTSQARALAAYVLVRRLGYRVTDVAPALGRNVATTSGTLWELGERLGQDEAAARQIERLVAIAEPKVEASPGPGGQVDGLRGARETKVEA